MRGFTLIELLVVMVLALAALSVVVPMFSSGVSHAELKGAARDLASGLRYARGQAIAHRQETALTLDIRTRRYQVSGNARIYRLPSKLELSLVTARSELFNEDVGAIRFYPDGTSTGGRITLASGPNRYMVDVNWLTGQVSILE